MANRSPLERSGNDPGRHERSTHAVAGERGARRIEGDARTFGRMKRALRKAERRAGDGTEIGGTGATVLKFLPPPLVRLAEKKRIGTEELRAADDISIAFHAQAGALLIRASGVEQVIATADAGSDVAVRWLKRLGFKPADDQRIEGKLLFIWRREAECVATMSPSFTETRPPSQPQP
jgi:hypothetical protein